MKSTLVRLRPLLDGLVTLADSKFFQSWQTVDNYPITSLAEIRRRLMRTRIDGLGLADTSARQDSAHINRGEARFQKAPCLPDDQCNDRASSETLPGNMDNRNSGFPAPYAQT